MALLVPCLIEIQSQLEQNASRVRTLWIASGVFPTSACGTNS